MRATKRTCDRMEHRRPIYNLREEDQSDEEPVGKTNKPTKQLVGMEKNKKEMNHHPLARRRELRNPNSRGFPPPESSTFVSRTKKVISALPIRKKWRKWTVEYGSWGGGRHWYVDGWKELSALNLIKEEDLCICELLPRSTKGCQRPAVLRGNNSLKPSRLSSKLPTDTGFSPPTITVNNHRIPEVGPEKDFVNQIQNLLHLSNHQQRNFKIVFPEEVFGFDGWFTYVDLAELARFANTICNQERMEWLLNWQLDLWAGYLYDKIRENNNRRIQFLSCLGISQTCDDRAVKGIIRQVSTAMQNRPAHIYVVPCHRNNHFFLLLICPNQSRFYCIDSKFGGITPKTEDCWKILTGIAGKYDRDIRSDNIEHPSDYSWKITNILHQKQPQHWECGYYVMLWMEKIAIGFGGVDIPTCFPEDRTSYSIYEIMAVTGRWCQAWVEKYAAVCEIDQLDE